MFDVPLTTQDLLERWRDAVRAAELAERLAQLAADSAEQAGERAMGSEEIARLAERAAEAAMRVAEEARAAADRARSVADQARGGKLADAAETAVAARGLERDAGAQYHKAEREARERQGDGEGRVPR